MISIRKSQDINDRLVNHKSKCGGKFNILPDFTAHWGFVFECTCGYKALLPISCIKAGRLFPWIEKTNPKISTMLMKINGYLVVKKI